MPLSPHHPPPYPRTPWLITMAWKDLLFLHYPVPADAVRPLLPPGLRPDTYEGSAWLSIVPFGMSGVRPRGLPPLPGISAFPQLNVRTYVTAGGKPGVYFFSMHAHSRPTVLLGRRLLYQPYRFASISMRREGAAVRFELLRPTPADPEFQCSYEPLPEPRRASAPGSLPYFLVERYCMYGMHDGRLYRGDIDHAPLQWRPARYAIERNTMAQDLGLSPGKPVLAQYVEQASVRAWFIQSIEAPGR